MKTLLITGANRGIGPELCKQYATAGWRVLACCREPYLEFELAHYSKQIKLHALDVTNHSQIEQLAHALSGETIDLLINNAGFFPAIDGRDFGHIDYADWMAAFGSNTMGLLKMVEAFVEHIAHSKNKLIVTITSQMGRIADDSGGGNLYRNSKVAATMLVNNLAVDLKEKGITSVAFDPGWVKTEIGSPNAMISVEQSVADMRKIIDGLTLEDTGKFIGNDGVVIPW